MRKQWLGLRVLALMSALLLAAAVAMPSAQAADLKKEYKMTVNVGPNFYWGMGATKFAELVKEKTNGQVVVKPYFGSALLKGAQLKSPQMVAKGVIDCAYESTINSSTVIPEMNVFSLPFFINTFENLDKMENGETGKAIFGAMEKIGLKPLAWAENGFRQITNSKKAIQSPEDLKGLRIRVVGSPIFMETFQAMGADPVNMNWGDAQTAFQQGVVDGQENPVGVLIPVQIWQYHKFASFWNYLVDPVIIYWNKAEWDAFTPEIQKAIQEAALESAKFEKALCRVGIDDGASLKILETEFKADWEKFLADGTVQADPIKFLEEKGMAVVSLTPEQLAAFQKATKSVLDKWTKELGDDIVGKAKADMGQ